MFLIYINDLPNGITSICKVFADNTSLFLKVLDVNESAKKLNSELVNGLFNGKCSLILILINRLKKSKVHFNPTLTFNNNDVKKCPHQKHLGIILDSKLDFNIHVDNKIKKCYKIIGIIKRLSVSALRKTLFTIYKSFIRPDLDYGDIL